MELGVVGPFPEFIAPVLFAIASDQPNERSTIPESTSAEVHRLAHREKGWMFVALRRVAQEPGLRLPRRRCLDSQGRGDTADMIGRHHGIQRSVGIPRPVADHIVEGYHCPRIVWVLSARLGH